MYRSDLKYFGPPHKKHFLDHLARDGSLYFFALPGVVFLLLFCYFPMAGLVLVFKNYNFRGGIFGSPWANPLFRNFLFFLIVSTGLSGPPETLFF
jgi:putative aldouronate transport system permease protein